jgi:PAS domain-containing protein/DNA-binding CsgD family transcriptional regulator
MEKSHGRTKHKIDSAFISSFDGFERVGSCMIGLTASGKIVYGNQSACEMLGYTKKELLRLSIQNLAPGMNPEAWSGFWSEVDQKGFCEKLETLKSGPPNPEEVLVNCRALRVQTAGKTGCIMFMSKPETTSVALLEVNKDREQLVQMLNAADNPVISSDGQHKITFMNRAACSLFATTMAEAAGKTVYDFLPKKYGDFIWEKETEVLESGKAVTLVGDAFLKAKYGVSATILPFLDSSASQKKFLTIINKPPAPDILPKDAQHRLEPLNPPISAFIAELRRQFEQNAIGIYLKNTENRFIWANQVFAAMLGMEPQELIGHYVEDLVHDPEELKVVKQEDDCVYATGQPLLNLKRINFANYLESHRVDKIPFIDPGSKITGIIGVVIKLEEKPVDLEELQEKLAAASQKLEDTETALRVIMEQRESHNALAKGNLTDKVKSLVLPYLENLKQTTLLPDQFQYVELIEENLKNIFDPNYAKLASPEYKLSPTELKVAQLVRDGKTNKEIAQLLHLSKSTILTHRHHIRVKLGIRNKKINLRSLLKS